MRILESSEADLPGHAKFYNRVVTEMPRRSRSGWWLVALGFTAGVIGLAAIQIAAVAS